MKYVALFATLIGLALAASIPSDKISLVKFLKPREPTVGKHRTVAPYETVENSLEQRLDNFDNSNPARFQQRYFMNGEFFQPGGPIIIVLGGEWEITPWLLHDSLPSNVASENQGYIFYLEHRYYGKSIPTKDVSTDSLKYLTIDQALADIAHFIHYIKQNYVIPGADHSHVLLVGSHYAGSLAVWFRQKYPHLAIGAWASSAPVLAKADHFEYKELSGAVYRRFGGTRCYDRLHEGFAELEHWVSDGDLDGLSHKFKLCTNLESGDDIKVFFNTIAEIFSYFVQVEEDWLLPIEEICDDLWLADSAAESIVQLYGILFENVDCVGISFNESVAVASTTDLDSASVLAGIRQWTYQLCDSLGWYHSSSSEHQPFGQSFPVDVFYNYCGAVFGERFNHNSIDSNIERQNTAHGGIDPDVTNVLFTQGELDPWRSVGVEDDHYYNATVIVIPGASHANDLRAFNEHDSTELTDAKFKILELLHYWFAHASGIEVIPV